MRVIKAVALLFALAGAAGPAQSQSTQSATKTTLDIAGMSCSACAKTVEKTAINLPGVKAVKVNQPFGTAEIEYEPGKTNAAEIAKAISKKTGFEAKLQATKK